MKKLLLLCAMTLMGIGQACPQDEEQGIFNHLGAGLSVGTTGIAIDLSTCITPYVGLRAGVDIMPGFKYSSDIKVRGGSNVQAQYDAVRILNPSLPALTVPDKVDIEGKLKNTTGHFLVDLYPGKDIDWHLTVGAYFGGSEVIDVYTSNDSQLLGVAQYNNSPERAALGYDKIGAQLGKYFLEPDNNGHVDADIKMAGFRPYVGLGWGRAVPKHHTLGFQVDLGVQFWGKPEVYLQGNKLSESDTEGEDGGFMKIMSKITVYPVLNFRLTGKFF